MLRSWRRMLVGAGLALWIGTELLVGLIVGVEFFHVSYSDEPAAQVAYAILIVALFTGAAVGLATRKRGGTDASSVVSFSDRHADRQLHLMGAAPEDGQGARSRSGGSESTLTPNASGDPQVDAMASYVWESRA